MDKDSKSNMKSDSRLIENAIAYITDLFRSDSGGHDAEHTLRVFRNAQIIAQKETRCSERIVSLAALLHDADDHKLFHTENNANARRFLSENQVPEDEIEQICAAINSVSFSQNKGRVPETLEGKIVQDADRLDAIGAIGIARTFAFGGEHGRPLEDSIQHFYDKLLRLKDLMNTQTGKALAEKRHAFLESFLDELEEESSMETLKTCSEAGCPERSVYKVTKIEEDIDFGCEERPEGAPVMAVVTLESLDGEEEVIRYPDKLLYGLGVCEGDLVYRNLKTGEIRKMAGG